MIRVTVELISANGPAHNRTLARMDIANMGDDTNPARGNYRGVTYRGRDKQLDKQNVMKNGRVMNWPREAYHVWNLVATMLRTMGYTNGQKTCTVCTYGDHVHGAEYEDLKQFT